MTSSHFDVQRTHRNQRKRVFQLRVITLITLAIVAFTAVITVAWLSSGGTIREVFPQLYILLSNLWLEMPMVERKYLLIPTVVLWLSVWAVMKISPQPRTWSRVFVVSVLLALTLRYLLWRLLATLNLDNTLNGVFSLGLFGLELLVVFSNSVQLFLMLRETNRSSDADRMSVAVIEKRFIPSVDILIPTYNEPVFILRRTIIGCQALDYDNKKVYILDDSQRREMRDLASELGCEYITRPDNKYAKAGNLNHALNKTTGELITVFDADFVPTTNFLTRTVGFFQNQTIALVQTHQEFYNADPIARNLGLEKILTQEVEIFSRHYQLLRDGADSALCYGSSFVVRRSHLEEANGFVTDSLSEDYFTGICLAAQGHQLIYLDEKLSAGLAAENMAAHISQRLRWARGTLQAFFIRANPLTIPGLRLRQRLAHLEGLLQWFTSLSRVAFLIIPLTYSCLGIVPFRTTVEAWLYFFLPYYLVQLSVFSWLNHRSRSALISDIYAVAQCFPMALTVIQTMLNPFSKGFQVTPKGTSSSRFYYNWSLSWPLMILWLATAVSLGMILQKLSSSQGLSISETAQQVASLKLGLTWAIYNLLMIGIALLILLDVPKPDIYEWFDLRRVVQLSIAGQKFWGVTTMISEAGAQIQLTQARFSPSSGEKLPLTVEIMEEELQLSGQIIHTRFKDEFPTVRVAFDSLSVTQHRQLVKMLFCRPGQWKRLATPGELQSLWLLFRIFLKPRALFNRNRDVSAMSVSQG